eukprot:jgi/Mesvir1/25447/Mv01718-RA.1
MAVPGLGLQVLSAVPVLDRVRLRHTCRTWLAAIDESFLGLTDIFAEDAAGMGCGPDMNGLAWLMDKCRKLTAISVSARADHEEPWGERDRISLTWPWAAADRYEGRIREGLVALEDIARKYQGLKYLNLAGCMDVTDAG